MTSMVECECCPCLHRARESDEATSVAMNLSAAWQHEDLLHHAAALAAGPGRDRQQSLVVQHGATPSASQNVVTTCASHKSLPGRCDELLIELLSLVASCRVTCCRWQSVKARSVPARRCPHFRILSN